MQTVLLDFSRSWGNSQAHLLALALVLHAEGRYAVGICCPRNSPLAHKARELQVPLLSLWGDNPSNPLTLLRLWLLTRRSHQCIIHTFSPAAALAGARLLRLRPPHGTLLLHNFPNSLSPILTSEKKGEEKGEETLPPHWHAAHKVLCANQHMYSLLREAGLSARQLVCLPAGVDTQALSRIHEQAAELAESITESGPESFTESTTEAALPPLSPQKPARRCIIASLTGRSDSHAHSILLKAMSAIWQSEDLPPWEIRIIGPCSNFQALLDEAHSLGVQSRLALLDDQPLTEVLPLCHVIVAPSTSPNGALPVMAAAWALGLPLLCPALPTNQAWAKQEENALFYSAEDPQQLAVCLKQLMHNPQLCQSLSEGGLRSVAATSIAAAVEHCKVLYTSLLHDKGWVLPPSPETPPTQANHEM